MENEIAYITSLIGDPIRTNILWTLLDGRAYTATELAISADTSPQNISMHLAKLLQAELLSGESQGRHKYYRISRPEVAYAIEAIGSIVPKKKHQEFVNHTFNSTIKFCRTCYDHLAGKVGVMLTESLLKQKIIALEKTEYTITNKGKKFFNDFEIDTEALKKQRRFFARPCLDWSERKYHLAGTLGAALLKELLSRDYFRKVKNSRAVIVTSEGSSQLYDKFKVSL